jgi:hypothetical protein
MLKKLKEKPASPISIFRLQLLLTLFAALITIRVIYIQHGVINPDAVLYYEAARLFTLDQWQDGFGIFSWPFYSLCIAFIQKIFTLSIENAASLLSVIFFGLTTFSLLNIIKLAGGKHREIIAGAFILFSSHHIVGITLSMHIRDQGFWAFFLTALVFFIRYSRNKYLFDAFFWQLFILIATLFRIEGLTYLLLLPISLFFSNNQSFKKNSLDFLKSNFFNLTVLLGICLTAYISHIITIKDFGRLHEVFGFTAYQEFTAQLFEKSKIYALNVLGRYLDEYATHGLVLTLLYASLIETIKSTGKAIVLLAGLTFYTKLNRTNNDTRNILLVTAAIALINFSLITIKAFVIADRYIFPFSFCIMIFAAFYLAHLSQFIFKKESLFKSLFALILITTLAVQLTKNILPKDKNYFYQMDAIAWLKKSNPENKAVFYDESILRYYADEPFTGKFGRNRRLTQTFIDNKSIQNYEYIVVNYYGKLDDPYIEALQSSLPSYCEIKKFHYSNSKYLVIYKKCNQKK